MKIALESFAKGLGYSDYKVQLLPDSDEAREAIGPAADPVVILDAIDALARDASGPADTMVVHFLGHGATVGGDVVLFVDGSSGPGFGSRRISVTQNILSPAWNSSRAQVKLVFLDACRVFVQTADSLGSGGTISVDSLVARRDDSTEGGTAIFFGAGSGDYGYVNEKVGYGFFTEALADLLVQSIPATAEGLNKSLRELVSGRVKQTLGPGFNQSPVMKPWLTAGIGEYRLARSPAVASAASVSMTTPARPSTAEKSSALSPDTSFVRFDRIIYDKRTGLAWLRDLNALGSSMELFKSYKTGDSSVEANVRALSQKAKELVVDNISGWRLASRDEIRVLEGMQPGSIFLNFRRAKGGERNAVGLFAVDGDRVGVWGMQYGDYLRGPTDWGWGDLTLNPYGAWLVAGPLKIGDMSAGRPIVAIRETRLELEQRPVFVRVLRKSSAAVQTIESLSTQVTVGNLQEESTAVAEYNIQRLQRAAIVRAELVMVGQQASGHDPSVDIDVYPGSGDEAGLSALSSTSGGKSWTPRWSFFSGGRIEVPQTEVLAARAAQGTLGIRFRYSGPLGNATFALPTLIVTYVPENSRLTNLPEFAKTD